MGLTGGAYTLCHCPRRSNLPHFSRQRAGLKPTWSHDPDVRAGRLQPDPELTSIFYGTRTDAGTKSFSYVIQRDKTAWQIAGDKYNSPDTIYKLPIYSGVVSYWP